jgi:phage tail-like protein
MANFKVSARRLDPYKNFKFRVLRGASRTPIAGFSKVGPLKRSVALAQRREAIAKKPSQRRTSFESITLERGVTHDRGFLKWASAMRDAGSSPRHRRRDVRVELRSKAGRPAQRYRLLRCRVSEFRQRPAPDAERRGVAIDRIRLEYAGCEGEFTPRVE